MLLRDLLRAPVQNYLYLERYVNRGSPSGFTRRYTTSAPYDPIEGTATFQLPCFRLPATRVEIFGDRDGETLKNWLGVDHVLFPVHPDMLSVFSECHGIDAFHERNISLSIAVSPTANGRTVYCHEERFRGFVKLHYEGILGRVMRGLPRPKAVAGVEISQELEEALLQNTAPSRMAILRECAALVEDSGSPSLETIGAVLRDPTAYPERKGTVLIPSFSLFSKDLLFPEHPELLLQILGTRQNPEDYLFDCIIQPLLQAYCYLVFERGLLPEINAQNMLLELDESGSPQRIVLRDFQGFEKDLTIREKRGLPCVFESAPYKCISENDGDTYYIRHSFSYDFKLGDYVIAPILDLYSVHFGRDKARLERRVANCFQEIAGSAVEGHFKPEDVYFVHKRELLTNERRYFRSSPPRYRSIGGGSIS